MDPKALREAAKAKAHRLAGGDDSANVDASGWKAPEKLKAGVKTGERPISPRAYKDGGAVPGGAAPATGGRKARKDGGKAITADSYQNRDMKEANEKRDGEKHVGGFASGGATIAKKADKLTSAAEEMVKGKGEMYQPKKSSPAEEFVKRPGRATGGTLKPDAPLKMAGTLKSDAPLATVIPLQDQVTANAGPRKAGGKVAKAGGGTIKPDAPLARTAPLPRAGSLQDQVIASAMKQRADDTETDPDYGPRKNGGKAMHGKDCACKECSGGRVKRKDGGRTVVNIVISGNKKPEEAQKPQMLPPMPPAPPVAAPPPAMMAPRPPMPMPGAPGGPGMPPMMARKDGGKVYPIESGSGGAKARLAKKGAYGLKMNKDLKK